MIWVSISSLGLCYIEQHKDRGPYAQTDYHCLSELFE